MGYVFGEGVKCKTFGALRLTCGVEKIAGVTLTKDSTETLHHFYQNDRDVVGDQEIRSFIAGHQSHVHQFIFCEDCRLTGTRPEVLSASTNLASTGPLVLLLERNSEMGRGCCTALLKNGILSYYNVSMN